MLQKLHLSKKDNSFLIFSCKCIPMGYVSTIQFREKTKKERINAYMYVYKYKTLHNNLIYNRVPEMDTYPVSSRGAENKGTYGF